ncbi:hypothetical protein SLA2020_272090 [Shorea laevis]
MKGVPNYLVALALMALACSIASAYDPTPLQDFCVAVNSSTDAVFFNGKFCKDPKLVTPNDFFFAGLNTPRNTSNQLGSNVTLLMINVGTTNAVALPVRSQNPGLVVISENLFGANPPISPKVLVKAFQVDTNVVESLQKKFS